MLNDHSFGAYCRSNFWVFPPMISSMVIQNWRWHLSGLLSSTGKAKMFWNLSWPTLSRPTSRNSFSAGVNSKPKGACYRLTGQSDVCSIAVDRYEGVAIKDFTTSWQDGLAFNALIHKFRPDLFDYEVILKNIATRNLEHAFTIAKNIFQIDRYLDVEGSY